MKKQLTIPAIGKQLLAIILGFIVIVVLSSIFAHLQVVAYPRASMSMYRRADLTRSDLINFMIRVVYVCFSCPQDAAPIG